MENEALSEGRSILRRFFQAAHDDAHNLFLTVVTSDEDGHSVHAPGELGGGASTRCLGVVNIQGMPGTRKIAVLLQGRGHRGLSEKWLELAAESGAFYLANFSGDDIVSAGDDPVALWASVVFANMRETDQIRPTEHEGIYELSAYGSSVETWRRLLFKTVGSSKSEKRPPGPRVTKEKIHHRTLVTKRYAEFKLEYKEFGYLRDTFPNAAKWMTDKFDDMDFLTKELSDPTDYDQIGKNVQNMIRAYRGTPEPKTRL